MPLTRRELLARGAGFAAVAALGPAFRFAPGAVAADPRLRSLRKTFRGQIITPGQSLYNTARLVFNANYDNVDPLAVVRPLNAKDVEAVVQWAAKTHVPITARSGGHSYAGYSTTTGVVIDLSHLAGVHVAAGRATIGPGARLGNVYNGLNLHGVAIPAGTCPSVGIGGHVLGGGFGLASRAWGLACDNLVSLQIVTANGQLVTASKTSHSDLFWACRGGGGGNFGIVTQLVFRTHAVSQGSYFIATWPWAQAEQVVDSFLRWAPNQPDGVGSLCRLAAGPGGPSVQIFGQFLGSENVLKSLLGSLHPPASNLVTGTSSWLDLVERWAGCLGHTLPQCAVPVPQGFVGASDYLAKVPTASQLSLFRQAVEARGTQGGALLIDSYGGALSRIAPNATAFAHRHELGSIQYFASGDETSARAWVNQSRATMAPAVSGGAYVNYIDPDLANWPQAYYGPNLPRLKQVKKKYDPHNLFHFAQSIRA